MDAPLITLRNITKRYGTGEAAFLALKGVSFDVHQGEFLAVMGPSGSGKSTTMNIIGALDRPTGGEYLFKGVHVENMTRDERKTWSCRFCTAGCPPKSGTKRQWRLSIA